MKRVRVTAVAAREARSTEATDEPHAGLTQAGTPPDVFALLHREYPERTSVTRAAEPQLACSVVEIIDLTLPRGASLTMASQISSICAWGVVAFAMAFLGLSGAPVPARQVRLVVVLSDSTFRRRRCSP
jgi:hypothetical protein